MSIEQVPQLATELDHWEVVLTGGAVVFLRAAAFAQRDGWYVFVALMEGTPRYEFELSRFPVAAVQDVFGGVATPPEDWPGSGARPF